MAVAQIGGAGEAVDQVRVCGGVERLDRCSQPRVEPSAQCLTSGELVGAIGLEHRRSEMPVRLEHLACGHGLAERQVHAVPVRLKICGGCVGVGDSEHLEQHPKAL